MEDLELPLDVDGFSRRECPRCHAPFLMRWTASEARVLAAALTRRVQHLNALEAEPGGPHFCPYCGCEAPADAFYTAEVQRHLDLTACALDAEVRWRSLRPRAALRHPEDDVGGSPLDALLPPLGDGGEDLPRLALPCCGTEQKVSGAWLGPIRCHRCGVAHLRAGPRDIGLELALLRQWAGEP
jgi:hypothetical protein